MTAAVDDAVITHALEYTAANFYVNNNIFWYLLLYICVYCL